MGTLLKVSYVGMLPRQCVPALLAGPTVPRHACLE